MISGWLVLFAAAGTAVAVVLWATGAGNRAVTGLAVGAGVAGLLIFILIVRSRSAYQQQAEREWATLNRIAGEEQRTRMQGTERMPSMAAVAVPDTAFVEAAPRAPEPDDDAIARRAPPAVREAPVATPASVQPPEMAVAPTWIAQANGRQANGEYYKVVSATGTSVDECWNRLFLVELPMAVHDYAIHEIGGAWPYPSVDGELVDLLLADQYLTPWREGGVRSDGSWNMQRLYVRLQFTPTVRERLLAQRTEMLRSSRVTYTAWLGLLACGALGIVFGYLKLDDQTLGAHSRRLRIGAIVLLVGIAFCGCLLLAYFVQVESYGGIFAAI